MHQKALVYFFKLVFAHQHPQTYMTTITGPASL